MTPGGFSLAAAAAVLLASAAPSAENGASDYSTKETRALTHAYARCVIKREARKASEALLADVPNDVLLKRYPMLIVGECLVRETHAATTMTFAGDLYRYALADALVNRELRDSPSPDLSAVPRLIHRGVTATPPERPADTGAKAQEAYRAALDRYDRARVFAFLDDYGECVVRTNAAGAKALLMTRPDSPEETESLAALRLALATCLPEGKTLTFGRVALRGAIAINYYRLNRAALAGARAGGAA